MRDVQLGAQVQDDPLPCSTPRADGGLLRLLQVWLEGPLPVAVEVALLDSLQDGGGELDLLAEHVLVPVSVMRDLVSDEPPHSLCYFGVISELDISESEVLQSFLLVLLVKGVRIKLRLPALPLWPLDLRGVGG